MGDTTHEYVELMARLHSIGVKELVADKMLYEFLLKYISFTFDLKALESFGASGEFRFYGILIREEDNSDEEKNAIHGKFINICNEKIQKDEK